MSPSKLQPDEDFIVTESTFINLIAGVVLLVVFFASMIIADFGWGHFLMGVGMFLVPGALFLGKSRNKKAAIKINREGIFHYGRLVTGWNAYAGAHYTQEQAAKSMSDNFVLLVDYHTVDDTIYTYKIGLSNTYDKSEEEIIEAIGFYYEVGRGVRH